jgi:arsenate reductase (thioredoxin)
MTDKVYNVLFACTHNSARSIVAEGLLNQMGVPRFHAFPAGSHPAGSVQPPPLQVLGERRVLTDGFRSKDRQEFAAPGAPALDFVCTVGDAVAGEVCPVWPGQPMTAHWGLPDPVALQGNDGKGLRGCEDAAITLKRRLELTLPLAAPDSLSLRRELRDRGQR